MSCGCVGVAVVVIPKEVSVVFHVLRHVSLEDFGCSEELRFVGLEGSVLISVFDFDKPIVVTVGLEGGRLFVEVEPDGGAGVTNAVEDAGLVE